MVVVLPDENVTTGEVADALTPSLAGVDGMLGENTHKVNLGMPRFKYMYKRLLNDDMKPWYGYSLYSAADFTNISEHDLMINRVIHQTFIETNEEGTEAAAATVVEIIFTTIGTGSTVVNVTLDHPFLILSGRPQQVPYYLWEK